MRYQRTQVYLDPDAHRRLKAEAHERGLSLAALLREVVSSHVGEQATPYRTPGLEALIGIVDTGTPSDIGGEGSSLKKNARSARYQKKMGLSPSGRAPKRARTKQ